jgi:hypothetical protein
VTTRALVEAALIGTARQPDRALDALGAELPVADLVTRIGDTMPIERRLLLAAAASDAYSRAGRMSTPDVAPIAPAAADTRPVCTPAASALIAELAALRPHLLLREALERLDAAGGIVAPARLPELLDTRDELIATVLPRVIGERGRWLAALTGDGDWLAPDAPDDEEARRAWTEGPHALRIAVLRARRHTEPADARAWLAESWTGESAEHRAELLAALEEALGPDDVEFLEGVLSDRSVVVRNVAVRLLARIPESDAARRFANRADAMLDYEPPASKGGLRAKLAKAIGAGGVGTLTVRLPESFEPSWERDALVAKPPTGAGERAYWLVQALALVRPMHWQERFGTSPQQLIDAARATDWSFALLEGWSQATLLVRDAEWATALWDAWLELNVDAKSAQREATVRGSMLRRLHPILPRAEAEARVLELMSRPLGNLPFGLGVIVDAVPRPWSAPFATQFLTRLREQVQAAASAEQWTAGIWYETLTPVALALSPESFADALDLERRLGEIETLPPAYRRKLDELRDTVRLRQRIHQEIRVEPAHR